MEIPPERLAAVPDTDLCVTCQKVRGDVARVQGYMSWEHKTAPTLVLGKEAEVLRRYDRKGFHAQLPLNNKENPRLRAHVGLCNLSLQVREEKPWEEVNLDPVNRNPSRCHPQRPRMNVFGDCLECALQKQKQRLRR
jgi:hypothetical protein